MKNLPKYAGTQSFGSQNRSKFDFDQTLNIEETRLVEFKEVKGKNPVSAIINAADEYAVAFLNSEGGRILWGVRDSDCGVVGVPLSTQDRDELRKGVSSKLHSIQPQIDPTRFRLEIHPVSGRTELFVVELVVPKVESTDPFYTGGHEAFVRLDGVKKRLSGPQLTAWIKGRAGASSFSSASVDEPSVLDLVNRIRSIFAAHGLEPSHLPRFLKIQGASFAIKLTDIQTDGALLGWLDEEKIDWISKTFLIRREWIDGEDDRIHEEQLFDKQPVQFFDTVSQHVDSLTLEDIPAKPEAYFIRWGKGKEWRSKGDSRVFVVLAVPLARFSNERIIFRYISDFQPYPWEYGRTNIQLRAWARLLFLNKGFFCHGREIPYKIGEEIESNTVFLHDLIENRKALVRTDWHPEDYALSPSESVVAKDVHTLPRVLKFLRAFGLPCELEEKSRSIKDRLA